MIAYASLKDPGARSKQVMAQLTSGHMGNGTIVASFWQQKQYTYYHAGETASVCDNKDIESLLPCYKDNETIASCHWHHIYKAVGQFIT